MIGFLIAAVGVLVGTWWLKYMRQDNVLLGLTGVILTIAAVTAPEVSGVLMGLVIASIVAASIALLIGMFMPNQWAHVAALAIGAITIGLVFVGNVDATILGWIAAGILLLVLIAVIVRPKRQKTVEHDQPTQQLPVQSPQGYYNGDGTQAFYGQQDSLRGVVDQGYRPVDGHYSQYPDGPQTRAY